MVVSFFQNMEAEEQLKFFQGCVAAAFAERDHSLMEVSLPKFYQSYFVMFLSIYFIKGIVFY